MSDVQSDEALKALLLKNKNRKKKRGRVKKIIIFLGIEQFYFVNM